VVGRAIDKLDELIYRARVHRAGTVLLKVPVSQLSCPRADVEVDIDMESYNDVTYLWGAFVRTATELEGITEGYVSFAEWGELDATSESTLFGRFWQWFRALRSGVHEQGRSFAAYCFWAQAENGAMNRAIETAAPGCPSREEVDAFRLAHPNEWIDIHDVAKNQIQTEGPVGLKSLAGAAGFRWRDEYPSGEASMIWYEHTRLPGAEADAARQRLLEYNEDDCRATLALRDWINGAARTLPHRDDREALGLDAAS
jgi:predicted RecB family nuclease